MFNKIFNKKKIIVTGHTGFKGSWLTLWLLSLGANVCGLSLKPNTTPSHFELLNIKNKILHQIIDIRNYNKVNKIIREYKPDYIFHLAAQSLVNQAYIDPLNTFETNVLGTTNILESLRNLDKKCVAVIITSDKCYYNLEWKRGYKENDILGGDEPYGSSKAATEIILNAYIKTFFKDSQKIKIGIGRAGNVIGGGDWSNNRIIPDCVMAWKKNLELKIRNPKSTRPWQFVLEPLSGYLSLAEHLTKKGVINGEPFNFGPNNYDKTVFQLIKAVSKNLLELKIKIVKNNKQSFKESSLLKLNCEKAKRLIKWQSALNFEQTANLTSQWYYDFYTKKHDTYNLSLNAINKYTKIAKDKGIIWAKK